MPGIWAQGRRPYGPVGPYPGQGVLDLYKLTLCPILIWYYVGTSLVLGWYYSEPLGECDDDGGDEGFFPEHPNPILHAPRYNISLTPMICPVLLPGAPLVQVWNAAIIGNEPPESAIAVAGADGQEGNYEGTSADFHLRIQAIILKRYMSEGCEACLFFFPLC